MPVTHVHHDQLPLGPFTEQQVEFSRYGSPVIFPLGRLVVTKRKSRHRGSDSIPPKADLRPRHWQR